MSISALMRQVSRQLSTLVRDELALARAEMVQKVQHMSKGAGAFVGAGVLGLYGLLGVLTAVVLLLARAMPDWGAALLVGVILLLVAGLLAFMGRRQVKRSTPLAPTAAAARIREDVETVRTAAEKRGEK